MQADAKLSNSISISASAIAHERSSSQQSHGHLLMGQQNEHATIIAYTSIVSNLLLPSIAVA